MSKKCLLTNRKAMTGHNRSHAMNATKRKFQLNLQNHRFWVPELQQFVKMRVSVKGIRLVDKLGFLEVINKNLLVD